ncbi:CCHC-type domain-containing protein [Fusarium sp. LHS14.1]|nr:CCHC-type domain-containing protein [Fusarium sp. LHS14.1]
MFFSKGRSESKSDEDVEGESQAFVHSFFQNVILPSSTAEDQRQFMLIAAADCLNRELTDDEVKELSISEAEMESTSSTLFYNDTMRLLRSGEANWPASLRSIQDYVRTNVYSGLPTDGCTLSLPCRFSKDTRLEVKTLDGPQGDEADIVFVDYVTVSHSGFTAESFRGTLALTRARGMTILLLNRGTFVGYERRKETTKRANHLYRIHNWHETRRLVQRLDGCLNCESLLHSTDRCKGKAPADNNNNNIDSPCERPSCGKEGHNAATCPTRLIARLETGGRLGR